MSEVRDTLPCEVLGFVAQDVAYTGSDVEKSALERDDVDKVRACLEEHEVEGVIAAIDIATRLAWGCAGGGG